MPTDYPSAYGALAGAVQAFLIGCHNRHDLERKLVLCELIAQGAITHREALRRFYALDNPALARQFEEKP